MIIRKSSQGHRIRLHRNTTPNAVRTKTYADGTVETLTYPSRYDYFVEVDGEVVKRSNNFETIEEYYVDECAKLYNNGHGRLIVGKHQVIGGIATLQSEFPDESNTKAEIKAWYDLRSISYSDNETKAELLSRIVENFNAKHIKK
tara:strand:+ start:37 stop:471 length:435 start_codon:yes stop_codon:yes gene_type:complete